MFPFWKWIVVPRTYQIVGHECDLLALTAAGYAHEIEIKVSLSDVKADLKKDHGHGDPDNRIKCFWFAMPSALAEKAALFVPERAGILAVGGSRENVAIYRKAEVNRGALPWSWRDRCILARTGMMKFWEEVQRARHAASVVSH